MSIFNRSAPPLQFPPKLDQLGFCITPFIINPAPSKMEDTKPVVSSNNLQSDNQFWIYNSSYFEACTRVHGEAEELKSKGIDEILCVSVNDSFVMKAWAKTYPENKHVKFLADGAANYTKALGLELDLADKGLGIRSKRYALLVDDLKVTVANIESGGEFTVSGADEILKAL